MEKLICKILDFTDEMVEWCKNQPLNKRQHLRKYRWQKFGLNRWNLCEIHMFNMDCSHHCTRMHTQLYAPLYAWGRPPIGSERELNGFVRISTRWILSTSCTNSKAVYFDWVYFDCLCVMSMNFAVMFVSHVNEFRCHVCESRQWVPLSCLWLMSMSSAVMLISHVNELCCHCQPEFIETSFDQIWISNFMIWYRIWCHSCKWRHIFVLSDWELCII